MMSSWTNKSFRKVVFLVQWLLQKDDTWNWLLLIVSSNRRDCLTENKLIAKVSDSLNLFHEFSHKPLSKIDTSHFTTSNVKLAFNFRAPFVQKHIWFYNIQNVLYSRIWQQFFFQFYWNKAFWLTQVHFCQVTHFKTNPPVQLMSSPHLITLQKGKFLKSRIFSFSTDLITAALGLRVVVFSFLLISRLPA